MKISYDKDADALAIIIREGRISRDMEIAEDVFAGFDRDGHLVETQILGVSERTLLRWIKSGKLKPFKVGREYRIKPVDLKKLAS